MRRAVFVVWRRAIMGPSLRIQSAMPVTRSRRPGEGAPPGRTGSTRVGRRSLSTPPAAGVPPPPAATDRTLPALSDSLPEGLEDGTGVGQTVDRTFPALA